jgi:uncharacterized protein YihD (DUF1040 family)
MKRYTASVASVQTQSSIANNTSREYGKEKQEQLLQRKITQATDGFPTIKYPEKILFDRNRLSQENTLTIAEYIISMKREVNPRLNYIRYTIQFLSELSKSSGIKKKFEDMTRDDILLYLDKCRKPEDEDPLHKWIGSYMSSVLY